MAERWPWLFVGLTPELSVLSPCGCGCYVTLTPQTVTRETRYGTRWLDYLVGSCPTCRHVYWAFHCDAPQLHRPSGG